MARVDPLIAEPVDVKEHLQDPRRAVLPDDAGPGALFNGLGEGVPGFAKTAFQERVVRQPPLCPIKAESVAAAGGVLEGAVEMIEGVPFLPDHEQHVAQ